LRNLQPRKGLCNGTRLIVRSLGRNVIQAEILIGQHVGESVLIPRILFASTNSDFPFILSRRQFPCRLSFIMTINKAQGQEFDQVGIYLASPVFSHGQLYTAFSRAKSADEIKLEICEADGQGKLKKESCDVFTKNVVCKEVLLFYKVLTCHEKVA